MPYFTVEDISRIVMHETFVLVRNVIIQTLPAPAAALIAL